MESPGGEGLSVRASRDGLVYEISATNDARYTTSGGLRVGSTSGDILGVLGEPSRVEQHPQEKTRSFWYNSGGVVFDLDLNPQARFYNAVYRITVFTPR
jgi:hypothetical protein